MILEASLPPEKDCQALWRASIWVMKLQQGQVWKTLDGYYRIVQWERLEVEYKFIQDLSTRDGTHHHTTKKEFCRLIKGATLLKPEESKSPAKD